MAQQDVRQKNVCTHTRIHVHTRTHARTGFLRWMSAGWASLQALRRKSEKSSSNRRRQAFIERAAHWKSGGVPYPSLLRAAPNLMQSAFYRASPGRSAPTECVCVCVKARVKSIQDLWRRCLSSWWEDRAREIMFIRTTVKKKKKRPNNREELVKLRMNYPNSPFSTRNRCCSGIIEEYTRLFLEPTFCFYRDIKLNCLASSATCGNSCINWMFRRFLHAPSVLWFNL